MQAAWRKRSTFHLDAVGLDLEELHDAAQAGGPFEGPDTGSAGP